MKNSFIKISFIIILIYLRIAIAEETLNNTESRHNATEYPYCFRFTWLGPKYNDDSEIGNLTCEDITKGAKKIPCKRPLAATINSEIPDTNWIWNKYNMTPSKVACRLSSGDVCAKISYYYNGAVENITYLCTKLTIDQEGAAPLGCYKHDYNGRKTEVCSCISSAGYPPCNFGNNLQINTILKFLLLFLYCGFCISFIISKYKY